MPRLVLDAMGGDYGPRVILEGAAQALSELLCWPGELIIVGDEQVIKPLLRKRRYKALREALDTNTTKTKKVHPDFKIRLFHTAQTIGMEDSVSAIRSKPIASINIGCELAKERDIPSAFISAGHSGAIMAASLIKMGRLPHVERPAIAVRLPNLSKDGCVLIDVGANVDCTPEHLRDFAIMGAVYAGLERHSTSLPRVAILSNGEERSKGTELTRSAFSLIEKLQCFKPGPKAIGQFMGYVEGKEIFKGQVDVVVADGFIGNVVLKSLEGLGTAVTTLLKNEAKRSPLTTLGFILSAGVFARFKRKLDYAEYGAAPLLGVAGHVFICHGRSNARAIKNALLRAQSALNGKLIERLQNVLEGTTQPITEVL